MLGYIEKILIVDDNKDVRETLFAQFELDEEVECFIASDGVEALKVLEEFEVHMVITDLNMPNLNGLDFCKEIRVRNQEVGLVVICGDIKTRDCLELLKLGISNIYLKPMNLEEVYVEIKAMLEKRIVAEMENVFLEKLFQEQAEIENYSELSISDKAKILIDYIE